MRFLILMICCGVASDGCATCPTGCEDSGRAKTLFAWQPGEKEKEDPKDANGKENGKDANGKENGNGAKPDEPEKPDQIATDRPDFTEASSTVGKGRVQLEAGYTYSRNRDSNVVDSHSFPEALLRIGMFADWFELRLGQNFADSRTGDPTSPLYTNGGEDLYLGVKLGLTEQKKCLPEMALVLQMTVPTGPADLTAGRVCPGWNLLYGWDLSDCMSFAGSTQANVAVDESSHSYLEFAQAVTVGYTFTEKLGGYTEFFALFPDGAIAPGTTPEYYFNGGITYKITDNFQYDIRAGVGLNRASDDFFVGSGFAVRY